MTAIQKLSSRHFKIIELCLRGWIPKQIAEHLGMSAQQVSNIVNSESFQYQISERRARLDDIVDQDIVDSTNKVDEAIAKHTMRAVERLGYIVNSPNAKDSDAIRAADSILDRGGHARVQKTEQRSVSVTIDAKDAALIKETMEMDR